MSNPGKLIRPTKDGGVIVNNTELSKHQSRGLVTAFATIVGCIGLGIFLYGFGGFCMGIGTGLVLALILGPIAKGLSILVSGS